MYYLNLSLMLFGSQTSLCLLDGDDLPDLRAVKFTAHTLTCTHTHTHSGYDIDDLMCYDLSGFRCVCVCVWEGIVTMQRCTGVKAKFWGITLEFYCLVKKGSTLVRETSK